MPDRAAPITLHPTTYSPRPVPTHQFLPTSGALTFRPMPDPSQPSQRARLRSRRDPGSARPIAAGPDHGLRRVRSDSGFAARRESGSGDGIGLAPADRRNADRRHWRRHRHGGRSQREAGRAPDTLGRADRCQRPGDQGAARAISHLRGRQCGPDAEQCRLAATDPAAGFPPRHRQALHHQLHAAEGIGEEPDGDRDLVHRIQLHADPGVRLLAPLPHRRLRAPDGRQRPVGQHHRGHRADRAAGGREAARAWSSRSSPRRREPSSARARTRTSGSMPGRPAPTSSTSSGSTPTTGTWSGASSSSPSCRSRRSVA